MPCPAMPSRHRTDATLPRVMVPMSVSGDRLSTPTLLESRRLPSTHEADLIPVHFLKEGKGRRVLRSRGLVCGGPEAVCKSVF